MLVHKISDRLDYLKKLVEKERTGTPDVLAEKLGISRRMLFRYIGYLKENGHEVSYCKIRQTYKIRQNNF